MLITRHMPWHAARDVRIRDGHRDEEAVLAALQAAGLLVRRATREEDLYGKTDCWVAYEGTVLGVDITTRVDGTPGWEAKRCADLMAGVVWLAIPQETLDRGLSPHAARDALACAVGLARLAWAALHCEPRPYPGGRRPVLAPEKCRQHCGRLRPPASSTSGRRAAGAPAI